MRRMYSEKQIKEMINEGLTPSAIVSKLVGQDVEINGLTSKGIANTGGLANIGNVAISGDLDVSGEGKGKVTAKTIEQSEYNFELDLATTISTGGYGWGSTTRTNYFSKLVQINKVLWLIINFNVANETESSISFNKPGFIISDIDASVGIQIIDNSGKNLTQNPVTPRLITGMPFSYGSGEPTKIDSSKLVHNAANQMALEFEAFPSLAAGATRTVSLRVPIIL